MLKIKEKWASLFIPKNTPYCHHSFKPNKKYGISAKPCKYFTIKNNMEYCKLLKDYLFIQDQVKDCGINDYDFEKVGNDNDMFYKRDI